MKKRKLRNNKVKNAIINFLLTFFWVNAYWYRYWNALCISKKYNFFNKVKLVFEQKQKILRIILCQLPC